MFDAEMCRELGRNVVQIPVVVGVHACPFRLTMLTTRLRHIKGFQKVHTQRHSRANLASRRTDITGHFNCLRLKDAADIAEHTHRRQSHTSATHTRRYGGLRRHDRTPQRSTPELERQQQPNRQRTGPAGHPAGPVLNHHHVASEATMEGFSYIRTFRRTTDRQNRRPPAPSASHPTDK